MKDIKSLIRAPRIIKNRDTERGELLKSFLANIQTTCDSKKFGKLTIARLAVKITGIPTKDLYYLKRVCEDSKNYGKRFFYELSENKHQVS